MNDAAMQQRAAALSRQIRAEDGVKQAVAIVQRTAKQVQYSG
jgi:hypothetical protein